MYLITGKHGNIVLSAFEVERVGEGYYIDSSYILPFKEEYNILSVDEVPKGETFETVCNKYLYSEEEGFTLNPKYIPPTYYDQIFKDELRRVTDMEIKLDERVASAELDMEYRLSLIELGLDRR